MSEIPELEAHKQGRDVLLAFNRDMSLVLSEAFDSYSEAIILGQAVSCEDTCLTTTTHLMEPFLSGALSRPLYTLFFSLLSCLDTEQISNLNWGLVHKGGSCNYSASLVQLLCLVQRRSINCQKLPRQRDPISSLHRAVCQHKDQKENVGGNVLRGWYLHFIWQDARDTCAARKCISQQVHGGWGCLSTTSAKRAVHYIYHGQNRQQSHSNDSN